MWTGKFGLNTLRVDGNILESGGKSCGFKNIRIRVPMGPAQLNSCHFAKKTENFFEVHIARQSPYDRGVWAELHGTTFSHATTAYDRPTT